MREDHYYIQHVGRKTDPVRLYALYRGAKADGDYERMYLELVPFITNIAYRYIHDYDHEICKDLAAELALELWTAMSTLVSKDFPSGVAILSFVSKRFNAEASAMYAIPLSNVIDVGVDDAPFSSTPLTSDHQYVLSARQSWRQQFIKDNIRFTGRARKYCIRLATQGRKSLKGMVTPELEKFLIDYVSVLARMGTREYDAT